MENNTKYTKRRRSYTEFRTSYSDNKKYFINTDKAGKGAALVKYLVIAAVMLVIALVGFLVTDALLNISEAPYNSEEAGEKNSVPEIDKKYFKTSAHKTAKIYLDGNVYFFTAEN